MGAGFNKHAPKCLESLRLPLNRGKNIVRKMSFHVLCSHWRNSFSRLRVASIALLGLLCAGPAVHTGFP